MFLHKALDGTKIETQFSEGDIDTLANNALNGRQVCGSRLPYFIVGKC